MQAHCSQAGACHPGSSLAPPPGPHPRDFCLFLFLPHSLSFHLLTIFTQKSSLGRSRLRMFLQECLLDGHFQWLRELDTQLSLTFPRESLPGSRAALSKIGAPATGTYLFKSIKMS